MTYRYWRGRLLLRLAKMFDRWAWKAANQAHQDLGPRAMNDSYPFAGPNDWGGR